MADDLLLRLLRDKLLVPRITQTEIFSVAPGHTYDYHSYADQFEIVYALSGSSYLNIENHCVKLNGNECLVIFPRTSHNFFLKKNMGCRLIDIIFDPGTLPDPALI